MKNTITYTFLGNCWKCDKFGHSAKECQSNLTIANQDQTYKGQIHINTTEPIRYPTFISLVRPPVSTQQITTDFQLSQEAWNTLSRQMTEITETNKLLKKAIKSTYKGQ